MVKPTLEEIVARVDALPSLPHVVTRVMQLTEDPDSTILDITAILDQDQSITAQVLRMANSIYYGYSRRIATVSDAIILVGFNTIRSIVLAASVSKILKKELSGYVMSEGALWTHSQCAAVFARMLARRAGFKSAELAYTATLLHDIGKVVLNSYLHDTYSEVIARVEESKLPFHLVEDALFGYNHASVGARVAEKWNLPPALVEAIACHHEPGKARENPELAAIVHVADAVTLQMGMGLGVDGLLYPFSSQALDALGLDETDLEELMSEVVDLFVDSDVLST